LQYSAPQIIRKCSRHMFSFTENRAPTTYPNCLHLGITTLEPL
jgi:hypothetical protein